MLLNTHFVYSADILRGRERNPHPQTYSAPITLSIREATGDDIPVAARMRLPGTERWIDIRACDDHLFLAVEDRAAATWIPDKSHDPIATFIAREAADMAANVRVGIDPSKGSAEDDADLKSLSDSTRNEQELRFTEAATGVAIIDGKLHTAIEEPVLIYSIGSSKKSRLTTSASAASSLRQDHHCLPFRLDQMDDAAEAFAFNNAPIEFQVLAPPALAFPSDQWLLLNAARILSWRRKGALRARRPAFHKSAIRALVRGDSAKDEERRALSETAFRALEGMLDETLKAFSAGDHDASALAEATQKVLATADDELRGDLGDAVDLVKTALSRLHEGASLPLDDGLANLF